MIYYSTYQGPLGLMVMTSDGDSLLSLDFYNGKYFTKDLKDFKENENLEVFKDTKTWLDQYFSGSIPKFFPKIKFQGTDFRKKVWKALVEIPYGQTLSYGEISKKLFGDKKHSQAVGGAVGHNPISIIVPCHRVLGADESLTGYAGGLDKKRFLLDLERITYRE